MCNENLSTFNLKTPRVLLYPPPLIHKVESISLLQSSLPNRQKIDLVQGDRRLRGKGELPLSLSRKGVRLGDLLVSPGVPSRTLTIRQYERAWYTWYK